MFPSVIKISIHALREEGDPQLRRPEAHRAISIHALREEGDIDTQMVMGVNMNFYPRPPRGGRRAIVFQDSGDFPISIHALREEGDLATAKSMA